LFVEPENKSPVVQFEVSHENTAPTDLNTVPKKAESRKHNRKAKPELWKRNIAKRLRQSGEEYVNRRNVVVPKKEPKYCDCSKCRLEILQALTATH